MGLVHTLLAANADVHAVNAYGETAMGNAAAKSAALAAELAVLADPPLTALWRVIKEVTCFRPPSRAP